MVVLPWACGTSTTGAYLFKAEANPNGAACRGAIIGCCMGYALPPIIGAAPIGAAPIGATPPIMPQYLPAKADETVDRGCSNP